MIKLSHMKKGKKQAPETILVTGGAGFIGSHLSKKLLDLGYKVVIIDNFNNYYNPQLKKDRIKHLLSGLKFKLYKTDIRNFKTLEAVFKKEKINKIIHLAAQAGVRYSLENPFVYADTNIMGTLNLLELSKKYKIKQFLFASSSSVYGGNTKLPFSERDQINKPLSLYAASKAASELIAFVYHSLYQIPCTGFRFFTVYGPWGRPDMSLCIFTKNILAGKKINLHNQGKMKRNFTYIDDIIAGIVLALHKKYPYEIFNLGGGEATDLNEYVALIEKNVKKKAQKNYIGIQSGEVVVTKADLIKARKMLGYNPKTPIKQGIKKFTDWYLKYYQSK
jgi:UDP-glucuronate 4-epimerase